MALPVAKTLADAVDFSKTVKPYLPQLYDLPDQVLSALKSGSQAPQALKVLYVSTNPLVTAIGLSVVLSAIIFVASEVNRNWSQVDRLWGILPASYNLNWALYAHATGVPSRRNDLLAAVSVIWASRLTFNYWRRGGYNIGSEDYRWAEVKKYIGSFLFFLLNIVFIATLQLAILLSITLPGYLMLVTSKWHGTADESADNIFAGIMVSLVLLLLIADNQQWYFFEAKKVYKKTAKVPAGYHAEDFDRGFNVTGLFAYSRHPNFLFEQSFWCVLYIWGAYTTQSPLNWTICGALSYLALFQGSTWLTELLSMQKYPKYEEYRRRVGRFLPAPPGGPPGDFSDERKNK